MPADILIVPNRNSTTINPNIQFSGSAVNTIRLEAQPSGSVAFVGNSGSLFSIVDSMSGSLMAVSDVSGLPILEVFSDDRVVMGKFNSNTLVVTGSRVGVGKSTPNATLDVNGNTIITGSLTITGSQYIRDGKFVLGTTTPDTVLSAAGDVFQLLSTSATFGFIARYSNNANGARFGFFKSRSTTIGGRGAVQAGDNLGRLTWFADSGASSGTEAATIYAENVASDSNRSRLIFAPGWSGVGLTTSMVVDEFGAQVTGSLTTTSTINGLTLRFKSARNVGVGENILNTTLSGYDNIAFGSNLLTGLTTGVKNVAIGAFANSTVGNYNVAVGADALANNTSGSDNIAIGNFALNANAHGGANVAIGSYAGRIVSGSGGTGYNVLIGYSAGYNQTSAQSNVIVGFNGGYNVTTGGNNTLIGRWTGQGITTGTDNTVIGSSITTGNVSGVVAIGDGFGNIRIYTDSNGNTSLGKTGPINAKLDVNGNVIVTGSFTVWNDNLYCRSSYLFLGATATEGIIFRDYTNNVTRATMQYFSSRVNYFSYSGSSGITNGFSWGTSVNDGAMDLNGSGSLLVSGSLSVGNIARSATSGEIRASNNITAYYSSDERLKTNIVKIDNPLEKIKQIDGVLFDWNDTYKKQYGEEDGYFIRKQNSGIIAQQVEKVFPNVVADRQDGYKAVRYELLVPLLIEAIKEQQVKIDELKNKLK